MSISLALSSCQTKEENPLSGSRFDLRNYAEPETVENAWRQVEEWLSCNVVWIPSAGERHAEILGGLIRRNVRRADLVPGAHLAALALEHGLILCSTDGDFAQFEGLRWENPL